MLPSSPPSRASSQSDYPMGIDFGLSRSARGRWRARIPSRYSALTRSASISTGTVIARSNRPASRSRRCNAGLSPYWTALLPAMRIVLPLTWISRSFLWMPGSSVISTISSPCRKTLSGGYAPAKRRMVSSAAARRGSLAGGLLKAGKDPGPLGRRRRGGWHGVGTVIISEYGAVVPGWLILPVSGSRQRVRDSRRVIAGNNAASTTVIATSSFEQHGKRLPPSPFRRPATIDLGCRSRCSRRGEAAFSQITTRSAASYFLLPGDPVTMRLDLPITVYQSLQSLIWRCRRAITALDGKVAANVVHHTRFGNERCGTGDFSLRSLEVIQ